MDWFDLVRIVNPNHLLTCNGFGNPDRSSFAIAMDSDLGYLLSVQVQAELALLRR